MDNHEKIKRVDNLITGASIGTVLLGIINILAVLVVKGVVVIDANSNGAGIATSFGVTIFAVLMGVTALVLAMLTVLYPIDHNYTKFPWHAGFFAMETCIIVAAILSFIAVYKCVVGQPPMWIPFAHLALFILGMSSITISLESMDKPKEV